MKTMEILPNTIAARGLPAVLADHREVRRFMEVLKDRVFDQVDVVMVYPGAHARALDTILWFAYGERPANFKPQDEPIYAQGETK